MATTCICRQLVAIQVVGYHLMIFFCSFSLPERPANNCLQIMVCLCVIPFKCVLLQITFRSCIVITPQSCVKKWLITSLSCERVIWQSINTYCALLQKILSYKWSQWKETRWLNDETIVELSYCKIWWYVSVSQISHFPQPSP